MKTVLKNIAEEKAKAQFMEKFSQEWNSALAKQMENSVKNGIVLLLNKWKIHFTVQIIKI